jgi:hypothetical protein
MRKRVEVVKADSIQNLWAATRLFRIKRYPTVRKQALVRFRAALRLGSRESGSKD